MGYFQYKLTGNDVTIVPFYVLNVGRGPTDGIRQKRKNEESVDRARRFGQDVADFGDVAAGSSSQNHPIPIGGSQAPPKKPTAVAKLHKKRIERTENVKDVMKILESKVINDKHAQ